MNKAAVVTGAGRGIGRAAALLLADAGYEVGLSARTESEVTAVAREIEAKGRRAVVVVGDVREEKTALDLVERTAALGVVTVAIAGAGQAKSKLLLDTTPDDLRALFEINVMGVHHLFRAAARPMIAAKQPGRLVAIASMASVRGMRFTSAYTASKHAVLGLVRCAALELAKDHITVNAICPGWVDTQMFDDTLDNIVKKTGRSREDARKAIESKIPLGRVSTVDDVMGSLRYVLDAPQVTGQAILIDGGEGL